MKYCASTGIVLNSSLDYWVLIWTYIIYVYIYCIVFSFSHPIVYKDVFFLPPSERFLRQSVFSLGSLSRLSGSPGVYQAPCRLHSWKPSVHEAPLQSSFHFSDHNVQSTNSLSCCAPNFDLFVHHSIWCVPSHLTLICLPMAPFINFSGHCGCQSRPAIALHLSQRETPVSCLTNPLTGWTSLGLRPSISPQLSPLSFFSSSHSILKLSYASRYPSLKKNPAECV